MTDQPIPAEYPIKAEFHEDQQAVEFKPHFHNSYEIILIQKGKADYTINSQAYTVQAGSLVFINNLEAHEVKVLEYPYRRYFILVRPDYFKAVINQPVLSSLFNNRSQNFRHVLELDPDALSDISRMIQCLYAECRQQDDFWEEAVKASLRQILIYLYRRNRTSFPLSTLSESRQVIVDIQKYLEEHYSEPIRLDELARQHFRDKYYLSHLFREVTGYTLKKYLLLQRLSRAKDLLYHTHASVTRICADAGFNNVNHFIRIFKKNEGTTPYQYRRKYR